MTSKGAASLTLYHYWRSSCSWRVRWGLALKGIPYVSVAVDLLAGGQRDPAYLKQNPAGYVPTLTVDGAPFSESLAILEWLDETYPTPPLLPVAPLDRMIVRQMSLAIAAGTQPFQNPVLLKHFVPEEKERPAHARHWIERGLAVYETLLARAQVRRPGPFSFGDSPTLADLCLVPQVYNARRFDCDLAKFPRLLAVEAHCLTTAACQAAAPDNQPGSPAHPIAK